MPNRMHGREGKGAARRVREEKRREAEFRDECTEPERTRKYRLSQGGAE